MRVSDRNVDLKTFFPFNCCEDTLLAKALKLGRCVKYSSGEIVLTNGSPAKHCGIIIAGEAVAFKTEPNGNRYQLCLKEGCFIGLESIRDNENYNGKVAAVTDLEVFFWKREGFCGFLEDDPDFAESLYMLDDGRIYQERYLIPETDITDPVLCSQGAHWISVFSPVFLILCVLSISLCGCSLLVRKYPVAWFLVAGLLAAAGIKLYQIIIAWSNERFLVTVKNAIIVPKNTNIENAVIRLYRLQSINVVQNAASRLIDVGSIELISDEKTVRTPLLKHPDKTALLIQCFGQKDSLGRSISVNSEYTRKEKLSAENKNTDHNFTDTQEYEDKKVRYEFKAHWALLIKMIIKPLILICVSLAGIFYFKNETNAVSIHTILLLVLLAGFVCLIYQFVSWNNHRFVIEENLIRDFSKKPFSAEDQNMAMTHKIESVRYQKKGFFQVLLNYGTVYILAGDGELSFDYVRDPKRVQQLIIDACSRDEYNRNQKAAFLQHPYDDRLDVPVNEKG